MKTSFVLHFDSLAMLDELTDEQAGQLFRAMKTFQLTGEMPQEFWLRVALTPFINQWSRDNLKWSKIADMRKELGKKGGEAKRDKLKQLVAIDSDSKQELANVAVSVSGSVSVSDSVNVSTNVDKTRAQKTKAPTEQEVIEFFTSNGYRSDIASNAFNYYDSASWRDSRGKAVINWKQKMRGVWFKDEHKAKESNQPTYQQSSKYRPV
jgi:hypothetical protein